MSPRSDSWRSSEIGRSARFQGRRICLTAVQQSVQIGCLSNTKFMHWEHQTSLWPVLDIFDFRFLSFELGLAKPDEAIFHAVAERLPFSRDRVLYFDDVAVNSNAARSFGFRSEHVRGIDEVRRALHELDASRLGESAKVGGHRSGVLGQRFSILLGELHEHRKPPRSCEQEKAGRGIRASDRTVQSISRRNWVQDHPEFFRSSHPNPTLWSGREGEGQGTSATVTTVTGRRCRGGHGGGPCLPHSCDMVALLPGERGTHPASITVLRTSNQKDPILEALGGIRRRNRRARWASREVAASRSPRPAGRRLSRLLMSASSLSLHSSRTLA